MLTTSIEAIPVVVEKKSVDETGGNVPYISSTDDLREYAETGEVEGARGHTRRTVVRLDTDEGITGWGETPTILSRGPGSHRSAVTLFEDVIEPAVVGRPVEEVGPFSDNDFGFQYGNDLNPLVASVEMAMWDAFGKRLGVPVHQMLGGKRTDEVATACCLGMLPLEEAREKAREFQELGFDVLKTKASRDWEHDVERIVAMDEATDGEMEFRLDPNEEWSVEDAVRVGARLEERGVFLQYLEQPIRANTFGAYTRLRQRLRQPVGVNEDMYESRNLLHLVKEDAIDVAVLEMMAAGGILGLRRMAAVGGAAGVSMSHHASTDLGLKTAAKLHAISATPAIDLAFDSVYHSLTDDVLASPFEFEDGHLPVPDGPGLGVTVDESKLEQHRVDTSS